MYYANFVCNSKYKNVWEEFLSDNWLMTNHHLWPWNNVNLLVILYSTPICETIIPRSLKHFTIKCHFMYIKQPAINHVSSYVVTGVSQDVLSSHESLTVTILYQIRLSLTTFTMWRSGEQHSTLWYCLHYCYFHFQLQSLFLQILILRSWVLNKSHYA